MSGTTAGGKKAAATNKKKYGKDFYKIQGAKGGRTGHTGGFASNPALAVVAGKKGGEKSRRGWKLVAENKDGSLIFQNNKTGEFDVKLK